MSELQHRQIKAAIEQEFGSKIDLDDYVGRSQEQRKNALLSRGLAAFILSHDADITAEVAARSIVDGYDDGGIDAIYYSPAESTLYICQSKWSSKHNGSVDQAAILKFQNGITQLLKPEKRSFNTKIQNRWTEIQDALNNTRRIVILLAYSGSGDASSHGVDALQTYIDSLNDTGDVFSLRLVSQENLYSILAHGIKGEPINFEVQLIEWGQKKEPIQAFYGQVVASEIAQWVKSHRQRLFARNIRMFLGESTQVNESISSTLTHAPSQFWYQNNGITVLCGSIRKKALGGATRDSGLFECGDVTIVNGAQTVGAISRMSESGVELDEALVPVRLISLENAPSEFAASVTRSTNTQNRIDARNFVALDGEQERIRTELLVEGIEYEFRQGDTEPKDLKRFGLLEATLAQACSQTTVDLAVQAKREIGKLWEDIASPPYKVLFNPSVSGSEIWSKVQTLRTLEIAIESEKSDRTEKQQQICIHGNRLIAHLALKALAENKPENSDTSLPEEAHAELIRDVVDQVSNIVSERYGESYLASLFKNLQKCREIAELVSTVDPYQLVEPRLDLPLS